MRTLIFILLLCSYSYAGENSLLSISFGPVQIGESRIPITLTDFKISVQSSQSISAQFVENSVQWIRMTSNLLAPRARMAIKLNNQGNIHLNYLDQSIIPEQRGNHLYTEIYVSLFNPAPLKVILDKKIVGTILVSASSSRKDQQTQLIDYSCAPYNLQLEGLNNEYISVGCRLERTGGFGNEYPRLEVSWSATNYHLVDGSAPPYLSIITGEHPTQALLEDQFGKRKILKIKATLPSKLKRLNTALGVGPYIFRTKQRESIRPAEPAFAGMLYANFHLLSNSSLRAFDALVWQNALFNNFGLYFAYELADAFDHRIKLIPLLGIQGLTFQVNRHHKGYSKMIYPQGFELVYQNAFGLENYSLIGGMFLSTSSEEHYKNMWIRFGKKIFLELNYIDWRDDNRLASMWGLSIGIPFVSFL